MMKLIRQVLIALRVLLKPLKLCRTRCHAVYLVGEHGTAGFYAVCELPERMVHALMGHELLFAFSIVLLAGIALIVADRLLGFCGF